MPHRGWGFSQQFFQWGSKIGFKCSVWSNSTLALRKVAPRNFATWRIITYVQFFWGGHGPLKIWEGKKRLNSPWFRTTFDFDREYLWNGFGYHHHHHHHHHQFYFRHLAHVHIKHIQTYSKTHTRNTQIVQIQVKLNKTVLLAVTTANIKNS